MKIPPLISYLGKSVGFGLAMAALLLLVFPNFRGGAPCRASSPMPAS